MTEKFIPTDYTRFNASPSSGHFPDQNDVTQPLAAALKTREYNHAVTAMNGTPQERRQAAQYFASRKNPADFLLLEKMGDDEDDETCVTATRAIVGLGLPAATPFFLRRLQHPRADIRKLACMGLRDRGSQEVVDAINLRSLHERDPEVLACLANTLISIGSCDETPPSLREVIYKMWTLEHPSRRPQ